MAADSPTTQDWQDNERAFAEKAGQNLLDAVNNMSFNDEIFAIEITTAHRTLQQSAMRAMAACIKKWGATEYYDDRNKATVACAKELMTVIARHHFPLI